LFRWMHSMLWFGVACSLWGSAGREVSAFSVTSLPNTWRLVLCLAAGSAAFILAVGVHLGRPLFAAAVGLVAALLIFVGIFAPTWLAR